MEKESKRGETSRVSLFVPLRVSLFVHCRFFVQERKRDKNGAHMICFNLYVVCFNFAKEHRLYPLFFNWWSIGPK